MVIAICQYKPDGVKNKDLQVAMIKSTKSRYVSRYYKDSNNKLHENSNEFETARSFQEVMGNSFYLELEYVCDTSKV